MLSNLKALVVILALACAVFYVAQPICVRYMTLETFKRRRNLWLGLTVVAFVVPAFWMFAVVALIALYRASTRDENPLAIYVLVMFLIPNVSFYLPTILINQLFDLTHFRMLSMVLIVPVMLRIFKRQDGWASPKFKLADVALMAFLILQVALNMPYETVTNTMRRGFLFMLDSFVVFYVFSRMSERRRLADVMTCFWLGGALLAPMAIFETAKGWLLYTDLSGAWGDPNGFAYLFRGDALRAQVTAGHSINLSYILAMTLGAFLYVRSRAVNPRSAWLVVGVMSLAVLATGSRGGWLTAALAATCYVVLRPNAGKRLAGTLLLGIVVIAVMYVTPLRESVLAKLPIIGTADQDTIEYRQQLAEVSWTLVRQNPFFGDPFAASRMEELRQGQGIIDIVNGYIFTALFTGLVGLFLLLLVFADALWKAFQSWRSVRHVSLEDATLGATLIGMMMGSLFYIATAGYGTITYIVAAMLISYATVNGKATRLRSTVYSFETRFKPS